MNGEDEGGAEAYRDAGAVTLAAPLALLVALALPPAGSLEREQVNGPVGSRLHRQLTRFSQYGFWGTVLVVRDGRVLLLKGYGFADAERHVRNGATTRFEMNSITKTFTGAAVRGQLFPPAGMRTALFRDEAPRGDTLFAHGYVGSPAGLEPGPPNPYGWGTLGAGGVWCTVGGVPTDAMFFPLARGRFAAFDPRGRSLTWLRFTGARGRSLAVQLADGRTLAARR